MIVESSVFRTDLGQNSGLLFGLHPLGRYSRFFACRPSGCGKERARTTFYMCQIDVEAVILSEKPVPRQMANPLPGRTSCQILKCDAVTLEGGDVK